MATIDYKEKYEQALEVAQRFYNNCVAITKKGLEDIFPELKESEDERIRKALIDYFDDANKADENPLQSYGVQTDKALAWIEKQGEQQKEHNICDTCDYNGSCINPCPAKLIGKQGEQKYNESDDERIRKHLIKHFGNKSKTAWNGMPVDKIIAWLEAQGEQKDLTDRFFEGFKQGEKCVIENYGKYGLQKSVNSTLDEKDEMDSAFTKMVENEQKPVEWSKNDRKIIEKLITIVDAKEYKNEVEWLISLYDRTIPQPKQEWSEKDERIKNNLLSELTNLSARKLIEKETEKKYASWLKSIRPQSQWKPSERQKEALLWCVVHLGGADKQTLGELLEELNKL